MSSGTHTYAVGLTWTGNRGSGTTGYRDYDRDHEVRSGDAPLLLGSADPAFRGNPTRWNPEQLLVASLAQCHQLWYLHLASEAGVVVTAYADEAVGTMAVSVLAQANSRVSRCVRRCRSPRIATQTSR